MIPIPPALMMNRVNQSVKILIRRRSHTLPKEAVSDDSGAGGVKRAVSSRDYRSRKWTMSPALNLPYSMQEEAGHHLDPLAASSV